MLVWLSSVPDRPSVPCLLIKSFSQLFSFFFSIISLSILNASAASSKGQQLGVWCVCILCEYVCQRGNAKDIKLD